MFLPALSTVTAVVRPRRRTDPAPACEHAAAPERVPLSLVLRAVWESPPVATFTAAAAVAWGLRRLTQLAEDAHAAVVELDELAAARRAELADLTAELDAAHGEHVRWTTLHTAGEAEPALPELAPAGRPATRPDEGPPPAGPDYPPAVIGADSIDLDHAEAAHAHALG